MAKVTPMPGGLQKPPRSRGRFIVLAHPTLGWIAQAWPPKHQPPLSSAYQVYKQAEFGTAGNMASRACYYDKATFQDWAKGTRYTWRDLAMRAMYGTLMTINNPDGTTWTPTRMANPNPQQILDLITNQKGCILYRDTDGWYGLVIGDGNDVLTVDASTGLPAWKAPQGGSGSSVIAQFIQNAQLVTASNNNLSNGYVRLFTFTPQVDCEATDIAIAVASNNATTTVQGGLYEMTAPNKGTLLGSTETITPANSFAVVLASFDTPVQLSAGVIYGAATYVNGTGLYSLASNAANRQYVSGQSELPTIFTAAGNSTDGDFWSGVKIAAPSS